jgi:hypothetical protein
MAHLLYESAGAYSSDLLGRSYGILRQPSVPGFQDDVAWIDALLVVEVCYRNDDNHWAILADCIATHDDNWSSTGFFRTFCRI